jgi:predicted O-methyltransferase YrrM
MRTFKHWTPHYIYSRIVEKQYRRTHATEPWLTPEAVRFLEGWLKPTDRALEFGAGRSTLWFAARVNSLTSVEHNPEWYERVKELIQTRGVQNVMLLNKSIEGSPAEYARVAEQFADESLDFVLVDGRLRDVCANACLPKLKAGGLLVLDNADVYLPSRVVTPNAHPGRFESEGWVTFSEMTKTWRCYWTCNGVSATAFFFKPC